MQVAEKVRDFIQDGLVVAPEPIDADGLVFVDEEIIVTSNESIDLDTPLLDGVLAAEDLLRLVTFLEESYRLKVKPSDITREHFGTIRAVDQFVDAELSRTSD